MMLSFIREDNGWYEKRNRMHFSMKLRMCPIFFVNLFGFPLGVICCFVVLVTKTKQLFIEK